MSDLMLINQFAVTEKKGKAITDSLNVSLIFGKRHDNVLQDIKNLDCSPEFNLLNFQETHYKDSKGRKQIMFDMTKDGFTFLVMGYKGKKAARFKEGYIFQFNEMESFIRNLLEAKLDFPEFTDAIMSTHEEPKHYHFSNELNMINKIVTGMDAKHFKELNGIDPTVKSIRPYLDSNQLEAVRSLQRIDIGLIISMQDYEQRKATLEKQYGRLSQKALAI